MKDIVYLPEAQRSLRRMPANMAVRIRGRIQAYAANPASQASNIKAMADGVSILLRVGDWRVSMRDYEVLEVSNVGPRGSIHD